MPFVVCDKEKIQQTEESSESFRLTILQSEYSNAFSLSTRQLHPGEQFDVFIDNTDIFKNVDHVKLHIEAESESTSNKGLLELNIQVISDAPSQIFDSEEYAFEVPTKFKTATVGTLKVNSAQSLISYICFYARLIAC
ncbi:unnamed protein product [Toxocara canis]|uniref:Transglut_C domain-containing protein n=1 Tax=Toxocara canis TaxID=6265 RepID=A0A183V2T3_TOXCA|nr:unnamed protein product [Toxocara canis]